MTNKYNKTFNKKIYTLNSENVGKNLRNLRDISFPKCPPSETMKNMALCFQRSKLMTIRIKFLNLVLLNICRFEATLYGKVCKVRIYFDSLSRNKIYLDELSFLRQRWSKLEVFGHQAFLELQTMGEDRRFRVPNSAKGLRVL